MEDIAKFSILTHQVNAALPSPPHKSLTGNCCLRAVFAQPTRANIKWADIERLFIAVGAEVSEGAGSRVRIKLGDQVKTFHRPHPGHEARRYAVEAAREFLTDHDIIPAP